MAKKSNKKKQVLPQSERKFYRHVVSMVVLTEEPLGENETLGTIISECDDGRYVGGKMDVKSKVLNGKQMVNELKKAGSDSEFFMLNPDGSDSDEADAGN